MNILHRKKELTSKGSIFTRDEAAVLKQLKQEKAKQMKEMLEQQIAENKRKKEFGTMEDKKIRSINKPSSPIKAERQFLSSEDSPYFAHKQESPTVLPKIINNSETKSNIDEHPNEIKIDKPMKAVSQTDIKPKLNKEIKKESFTEKKDPESMDVTVDKNSEWEEMKKQIELLSKENMNLKDAITMIRENQSQASERPPLPPNKPVKKFTSANDKSKIQRKKQEEAYFAKVIHVNSPLK